MRKKRKQYLMRIRRQKITGKQRLVLLLGVVCFILICIGIVSFYVVRTKTTIIGFYDIPELYISSIESFATKESLYKTKFLVLDEKQALSGRLSKKIDILVTYTGALTSDLDSKAVFLPSALQGRFSTSIRTSPFFTTVSKAGTTEFRVMPLLLDHFETSYFTVFQKKLRQQLPVTFSQFESYAADCRKFVEYPIVCAGALDDNLFGLVSVMIESLGGKDGYIDFVDGLKAARNFDQALSIPIKGTVSAGITFATVLDTIKRWQRENILLPEWYKTKEQTVNVFMEDNHAAVIFMSLQSHRRKPFPMIKYFNGTFFPPQTNGVHSIIEPSVSAMMFRSTVSGRIFMNRLSSEEGQENLSLSTKIGPAALRGEAFDIQADDVRFLAAATPGGPAPDIGTAVYKDKKHRSAFAAEIRNYLSR